ncbi:T9SS type A sorting domain-containing protein [uncultured Flavobacterium sp.]|uniref:T9SS type A sorting domain-containing protein n=1 Tax=uncultured Flavobacterium sp. TaxID=165435 RepID=UPI0025EC0A92|nr:T9SS type A sorting domain-containing protein [uncultured Flavobacterium sp.]
MKYNYLKSLFVVTLLLVAFSNQAQEYTVTSIPFQNFSFANISHALNSNDDRYSEIVDLKGTNALAPIFNFNFYGNTYDKVVVSSNGYIDFRTSFANTASQYRFMTPIPNVDFPTKNSILGCYHDMVTPLSTQNFEGVNYAVSGIAPARRFIVSFVDMPLYRCSGLKSSFQIVLYEGSNNIDVFIKNKPNFCTQALNKLSVVGLINGDGTKGISPSGRNVGEWAAEFEGWRFTQNHLPTAPYTYATCVTAFNNAVYNLDFIRQELSEPNMVFFRTIAESNANDYALLNNLYTPAAGFHMLYGRGASGALTEIRLEVVYCGEDDEFNTGDFDGDGIPNTLEDVNGDGNLANDDTDGDGIPNYRDSDDDGDAVPTSVEYVLSSVGRNLVPLDTDNDGIPNYLDNDDDGDGVLTINEDYNHNGNPADDDTNNNGIPDYLESAVALGVKNNDFKNLVSLYPNPASTILNIENRNGEEIKSVSIYSITGALVKQVNNAQVIESISVSELQTGMYFIKMQVGDQIINSKIIKK